MGFAIIKNLNREFFIFIMGSTWSKFLANLKGKHTCFNMLCIGKFAPDEKTSFVKRNVEKWIESNAIFILCVYSDGERLELRVNQRNQQLLVENIDTTRKPDLIQYICQGEY